MGNVPSITSGKLQVDNNIYREYIDLIIPSKSPFGFSSGCLNRKLPSKPKMNMLQNKRKKTVLVLHKSNRIFSQAMRRFLIRRMIMKPLKTKFIIGKALRNNSTIISKMLIPIIENNTLCIILYCFVKNPSCFFSL